VVGVICGEGHPNKPMATALENITILNVAKVPQRPLRAINSMIKITPIMIGNKFSISACLASGHAALVMVTPVK
jgi:hypothetical protein